MARITYEDKLIEEKIFCGFQIGNFISTGYESLDNLLGGGIIFPSFSIIGGRPAIGKTMVMLNLLKNISSNTQCSWISLCESTNFSRKRYKDIGGNDENIFFTTVFTYENCIKEIRERNEKGCKIFFIDYFQLLNNSREDFYEHAAFISHELKKITLELGISLIVSSQLIRKCEERTGHRPILTDLRDSGTLEEDADVVLLISRREYYDPNDKPGVVEIILAKSRFSDRGNIFLCRDDYSLFEMEINPFQTFVI